MLRMPFKQGDRILFQGDSVTDCDRDRNDSYSLAVGTLPSLPSIFGAIFPCLKLTILNRGVSGDRVYDGYPVGG